jgi:signal peptidase II
MKKRVAAGLLITILIFIDQLTKLLAKRYLLGKPDISLIKNVFSLHYLENQGAAFGILKNQQVLFVIMTVLILGGVIYGVSKLPKAKKYLPLQVVALLVCAGAVGNLIDRLRYGYVIDFFYFELIDFPVFNVADCYVTLAAALLAYLVLWHYKEEDFGFLNCF